MSTVIGQILLKIASHKIADWADVEAMHTPSELAAMAKREAIINNLPESTSWGDYKKFRDAGRDRAVAGQKALGYTGEALQAGIPRSAEVYSHGQLEMMKMRGLGSPNFDPKLVQEMGAPQMVGHDIGENKRFWQGWRKAGLPVHEGQEKMINALAPSPQGGGAGGGMRTVAGGTPTMAGGTPTAIPASGVRTVANDVRTVAPAAATTAVQSIPASGAATVAGAAPNAKPGWTKPIGKLFKTIGGALRKVAYTQEEFAALSPEVQNAYVQQASTSRKIPAVPETRPGARLSPEQAAAIRSPATVIPARAAPVASVPRPVTAAPTIEISGPTPAGWSPKPPPAAAIPASAPVVDAAPVVKSEVKQIAKATRSAASSAPSKAPKGKGGKAALLGALATLALGGTGAGFAATRRKAQQALPIPAAGEITATNPNPAPPPEQAVSSLVQNMKTAALDELVKMGAVTEDQAQAALDRIDALEAAKPTASQLGRYSAIGAAAAPVIGMVGNAIRGRKLIDPTRPGLFGYAREVASDAAKGALGAGLVPILRHRSDQAAEKNILRRYLDDPETPAAPAQAVPAVPKVAFQTSQYSGPLSYGSFPMVSALPGFKKPSLRSLIEKTSGIALTPRGRLSSSMGVGKTPGALAKGPSIAAIGKPPGMGVPIAGATNPSRAV